MKRSTIWLGACSMLAMALATNAAAQTQSDQQSSVGNGIEQVVVTAQKRAENVQDVPLSIVAISGTQLEKSGITNVTMLQQVVPSFQLYTIAQASGVTLLVRGFGSNSNGAIDPDVAPYIDGIYIPRPGAILTSFLDISTVEVLRGPQGTLSGRNATVGALELTTNQPSFRGYSGMASVDVSSYYTAKGQLVANVPVTDTFALRAALQVNSTDGYIHNIYDGNTYGASKTQTGRLSAKWAIAPNLTWVGRLDLSKTTGDGVNDNALDVQSAPATQLANFVNKVAAAGGTLSLHGNSSYNNNQHYTNPTLNDAQSGISSDLTWDAWGGYKVRLIDSYRDWHNNQNDGDNSGTTLDIYHRRAHFGSTSQSHELQLLSPKDQLLGGNLNFVTGFYYFNESYKIRSANDLGSQWCTVVVAAAGQAACKAAPLANAAASAFTQNEESYAGYVQGDYKLTKKLVLTLGARITSDDKTGTFNNVLNNPGAASLGAAESENNLTTSKTKPTYRANLSWTPMSGLMTYVSYSTGYKSGGFNSAGASPALSTATRTFSDETSTNYEAGIKATLLNHRLQLNADIYQMDIDNFQQRSFNGQFFVIRNAGNIRSRGLEMDAQYRITDHFRLDFGGDYLYSYYTSNPTAAGLPGCSAAVVNSCVGYEAIVGGNPAVQNLTGRPNSLSPKFQGNIALQYDSAPFMGGYILQVRPDVSYLGRFYSSPDDNPQAVINSHTLLDLRINLVSPDEKYTLTIYGTNLTNEHYWTLKYAQPLAAAFGGGNAVTGQSLLRGFMGQPATVGIKLAARF